MGARRGVTKQRHGTELIGEGYYVYCGRFEVKKGWCSGGRRGGRGSDRCGASGIARSRSRRSKDGE